MDKLNTSLAGASQQTGASQPGASQETPSDESQINQQSYQTLSVQMDTTTSASEGGNNIENPEIGIMISTKNNNETEDLFFDALRGDRSRNASETSDVSRKSKRRKTMNGEIPIFSGEFSYLQLFDTKQKELNEAIEKQRLKSSKITKETQETFKEKLNGMRDIILLLALENASLKGRLQEREEREERDLDMAPPISFRDVVRTQRSEKKEKIPPVTGASKKKVPEKRHTIIVKHDKRDPTKPIAKATVISLLNPVQQKLRIKTCRNTRAGDIVIEAATAEDLQKIKENESLSNSGYKFERPSTRLPKVIIYDVPSEFNEEEVRQAIILQNGDRLDEADREKICKDLHFKFKSGKREQETSNRVYEVSPDLRNLLRRLNNVYIDVRRCKISDFVAATRCFKCHGLGHITKYCKATQDICGHCAEEGHDFKSCPNKARPKVCATCKRAGKPHKHIMDKNCPEYKAALEQIRLKTDYG